MSWASAAISWRRSIVIWFEPSKCTVDVPDEVVLTAQDDDDDDGGDDFLSMFMIDLIDGTLKNGGLIDNVDKTIFTIDVVWKKHDLFGCFNIFCRSEEEKK